MKINTPNVINQTIVAPKKSTPEKSLTVLYAVIAAIIALGLAVVAAIPSAAVVAPLAIVVGLTAVTLAILSLREIL